MCPSCGFLWCCHCKGSLHSHSHLSTQISHSQQHWDVRAIPALPSPFPTPIHSSWYFLYAVCTCSLAHPPPAPGSSALQGARALSLVPAAIPWTPAETMWPHCHPCGHTAGSAQPKDIKDVNLVKDTARALLLHSTEAQSHFSSLHPGLQNSNLYDFCA